MAYTSIHNHTHYSNLRLLDCIIRPTDLIDEAYKLGLKGIAITDHESLSAHIEAIQHYKKKYLNTDFKLILGNEIYLVDEKKSGSQYYHFIILSKNKTGHRALRELSSIAWRDSYFDRGMERVPVTKDELREVVKKYPGSLMATSACIGGELSQNILRLIVAENLNDQEKIKEYKSNITEFLFFMKEVFENDFYLEIAPNSSEEQRIVNTRMKSISNFFEIPILFASDSHYLKKEDREIHKAFLNSKDGEREVDDFYTTAFLMSPEDAWDYLKEDFSQDEFQEMMNVSNTIYDKVEFYDLYKPQIIPNVELNIKGTKFKDLEKYEYVLALLNSDNIQDKYWAETCLNRLAEIKLWNDVYLSRLDDEAKEIYLISKNLDLQMTSYYNTMSKIMDIVWEGGDSLVGVARGSATGFLSCYLLQITQLDPIKWKLPHWRHLTSSRPELPDIDFDTQALRRGQILEAIKDFFGEKNVLNICTFGTEGPKSAILTACRGLGIDSDIGLYLTGMIPQERGFTWPLQDCLYGNKEKGREPIHQLKKEVEKYDKLEEVILKIEGLVNKRSIHAAGIYIFNDGFEEMNALMRAPNGQAITQWDMSDSDYMGCLKYDFLTVEALDKIRVALDLLIEDNFIQWQGSLKETYNKYLHPDILDYSTEMWEAASNGEVINLFQFDTLVGGQAIKKVKPKSLEDAASANSLMRLMPLEDGTVPVDKYIKFKNDLKLWYREMKNFGLTEEEMKMLEPHYLPVYGVPNTQEDMMEVLMNLDLIGFSIEEANYARKIVGKKKMDEIPKLKNMIYTKAKIRKNVVDYIYYTAIEPQLGYSFSRNHTMPYTTIALQELNLFNKYPTLYWNTACLTINAGAADEVEGKGTDYAKMAAAIGYIKSQGVEVSLANINKSSFGFKPDLKNDRILYGLKSISNLGDDISKLIIENRPYESMEDFIEKCSPSKTAMVSLIKAGAFDEIEGKPREEIMKNYIASTIEVKKRITLQNMPVLLQEGLIPEEFKFEAQLFEFNRYLRTNLKKGNYYILDDRAYQFFMRHFDQDLLTIADNKEAILINKWDKAYNIKMLRLKDWMKDQAGELIRTLHTDVFNSEWEKYASGNIAAWEMDAVCFYHSFHELDKADVDKYGISSFYDLPEEPVVEKYLEFGKKKIPIFTTYLIAGTMIGKDKIKSTISLLTTDGVVYVKFRPEQFAYYDKQLSQQQSDGKKKIMERSWFTRGKKVLLTGFRRGSEFVPKTYKHTATETLYLIDEITEDGELILRRERS